MLNHLFCHGTECPLSPADLVVLTACADYEKYSSEEHAT